MGVCSEAHVHTATVLGLIEAWLSHVKPVCWAYTMLGALNYHLPSAGWKAEWSWLIIFPFRHPLHFSARRGFQKRCLLIICLWFTPADIYICIILLYYYIVRIFYVCIMARWLSTSCQKNRCWLNCRLLQLPTSFFISGSWWPDSSIQHIAGVQQILEAIAEASSNSPIYLPQKNMSKFSSQMNDHSLCGDCLTWARVGWYTVIYCRILAIKWLRYIYK